MTGIVFIGDELTAAGFRLTGIETLVPPAGTVREALLEARTRADLVVLTVDYARQVPMGELEDILSLEMPLVAVIPDILARIPPPDLARRLRVTLGIET